MQIAPEGRNFIIIAFIATIAFFLLEINNPNSWFLTLYGISGLSLIFMLVFFRNPNRNAPSGKEFIIAPSDGKIVDINKIDDPEIGNRSTKISIFLNIFNVHVNWMPLSGNIQSVKHKKGKFLSAFDHRASDENEQTEIIIDGDKVKIKVKQVAGLIARRIKCYAEPGSTMELGSRLGFIMFGSRMDIILPSSIRPVVTLNQKVLGCKTVIGRLK